jgi:hypothetical protein
MTVRFADNFVKQREVYEWVKILRVGRLYVYNALSGCPFTVTCVEVKEQIHQHIRDNRRKGIDETETEMRISRR